MKVKTLIRELKKLNSEAIVKLSSRNGSVVLFANTPQDNSLVLIENESDIDLKKEIGARFKKAIEEQWDELDFYMELLEVGINVDMVRKYVGEDHADHMERYCRTHALM